MEVRLSSLTRRNVRLESLTYSQRSERCRTRAVS
jgi:hypothetical protein